MAMNADWLELANPITPEVMKVLTYFCRDTTERILINLARMHTHNTGALAKSIHATVYNNAGGNDALIRFYYMNYGSFLEHGLGRYYVVDDDLTKKKSDKAVGVKRRNVDVPGIGGSNFDAINTNISGIPDTIKGGKYSGKSRGSIHKAKPAINSEIRLHLRGTQDRLAKTLAFTATAYVLRGMVMGMTKTTYSEKRQIAQEYYKGDKSIDTSGYAFNFVPDMKGEEAWLATKGYLKQIQYGWRLSSVGKELLEL